MPAAFVIPAIIGAGASVATSIYAGHKQSEAAKQAGAQQTTANRESLAFQREQAALDRQEKARTDAINREIYERALEEDKRRYALDSGFTRQQYADRERRLGPYRRTGVAALGQLANAADLVVNPNVPVEQMLPQSTPQMPPASAAALGELARLRGGR